MEHGSYSLFDQSGFMPHGHCYLWKPGLVWLHVLSDTLIGVAYVAIALLLYLLVRKIRLPFSPIFLAFGVFIGACGLTHFMAVWTLWNPDYWVSGLVKALTAVASVATGVGLAFVRPKIEEFANSARLSEERRVKLQSAHAELEKLYDKVRESDLLKTQFFANVSHELRTPLALILGPTEEVMQEGNLSAGQRKKLEVVLRNSKTLLKQVNDLLDISKLEAGRMRPNYAKADLVKLFTYVVAHFETLMQSRNIFFSLHAPDSIPAEVDPEKVQRVYMNLLSNSVKFIPEGGRIRTSIQVEGDRAIFTIEDNGPGVAPELRELIFERFQQGEAGVTRKFGGTGLGLAIAKDFIETLGGSIKLLNGHSHGATFVVAIPLKAPPGAEVADHPETVGKIDDVMLEGTVQGMIPETSELIEASGDMERPTVLVCEDNPDMNQFIAETLATEFNVLRAIDGAEGLAKARALLPSLIVSDIMMPYMGGDELVRELQKDATLKEIPVLLLSARADDDLRITLLREGASDYLTKPFAAEELRARASNLVALKVARDVLEKEVSGKSASLVEMAEELSARKRDAELAFTVAQAAREEAERASEVKGAFLSLVSHELNTPLMAMNLNIQLMQRKNRDELDSPQREMIDRLAGSSKQLKSLVEGLLEYVRSGQQENLNIATADLGQLTHEIVQEFEVMAAKKGLELRVLIDEGLEAVPLDVMKVRVILNNLIVNALKFTEEGFVEVHCSPTEGGVLITVRDTGPGIPKADQARVFEPFERLEPLERKSIPGMGLGLSLVKQLVETLRGKIRVQSEEGQGTTFIIEL